MASIIDGIIEGVVADLTRTMITEEPDEDLHPGLIRGGLLQENPVPYRIVVLVHHNDPDDTSSDPFWADLTANEDDVSGWKMPPAELGGGQFMSRRFLVDIKIYLVRTKENRSTARAVATAVIENAEKALQIGASGGWNLVSDQGEIPLMLKVYKVVSNEGGGPPSSHIWTSKIMFSVLTERP